MLPRFDNKEVESMRVFQARRPPMEAGATLPLSRGYAGQARFPARRLQTNSYLRKQPAEPYMPPEHNLPQLTKHGKAVPSHTLNVYSSARPSTTPYPVRGPPPTPYNRLWTPKNGALAEDEEHVEEPGGPVHKPAAHPSVVSSQEMYKPSQGKAASRPRTQGALLMNGRAGGGGPGYGTSKIPGGYSRSNTPGARQLYSRQGHAGFSPQKGPPRNAFNDAPPLPGGPLQRAASLSPSYDVRGDGLISPHSNKLGRGRLAHANATNFIRAAPHSRGSMGHHPMGSRKQRPTSARRSHRAKHPPSQPRGPGGAHYQKQHPQQYRQQYHQQQQQQQQSGLYATFPHPSQTPGGYGVLSQSQGMHPSQHFHTNSQPHSHSHPHPPAQQQFRVRQEPRRAALAAAPDAALLHRQPHPRARRPPDVPQRPPSRGASRKLQPRGRAAPAWPGTAVRARDQAPEDVPGQGGAHATAGAGLGAAATQGSRRRANRAGHGTGPGPGAKPLQGGGPGGAAHTSSRRAARIAGPPRTRQGAGGRAQSREEGDQGGPGGHGGVESAEEKALESEIPEGDKIFKHIEDLQMAARVPDARVKIPRDVIEMVRLPDADGPTWRVLGGQYEVSKVVGEGAYGMVMKSRDRNSATVVAIKEFKVNDDDPDAEEVRRTSRREVGLLKSLTHKNIVKYLNEFYEKEKLYVVMEFVPRNLLEVLEAHNNGLNVEVVRCCMFQLCKAMQFIHKQDIVYRDIKPENLLIDPEGTLKLCDFGFARKVSSEHTVLTDYVATRWYRAPELLLGPPFRDENGREVRSPYGKAVDMWAVGCLMGELSDGEPMFAGDSDIDQLMRIQKVQGQLTPTQSALFRKNPSNSGVDTSTSKEDDLSLKYGNVLDAAAIDFMRGLLHIDPKKRLTAEDSLRHPYFKIFWEVGGIPV
eukprot:CAMPEP_0114271290 /NCGR_PEP_ID=MMETSP0058-20121206/27764_1 /TAXON_ID=36894 /ORGANISM="Pyramimonas parkeae, CCMP726" /LENGTH=920 /DNA_ID=CAMNT_0001390227 /DNA_START=291 /DNA_END=3055 /DNA_ORIENTATION=+